MFSVTPIFSYATDVASSAPVLPVTQQREALEGEENSTKTEEFCMIEAFSYVVDWVEKAIKRIEGEQSPAKSTDTPEKTALVPSAAATPVAATISEEDTNVVLDLTIPDTKYEGTMGVDKGQKLNFPDLFSTQAKKPYSKEVPSSSFGGRLLMDDAELESMEEYRLNSVREAVRGAEVSLEFKTN